jgi:hypothetical protein
VVVSSNKNPVEGHKQELLVVSLYNHKPSYSLLSWFFFDAISFIFSHLFVFGMLHPCVASSHFVILVHIIALNP